MLAAGVVLAAVVMAPPAYAQDECRDVRKQAERARNRGALDQAIGLLEKAREICRGDDRARVTANLCAAYRRAERLLEAWGLLGEVLEQPPSGADPQRFRTLRQEIERELLRDHGRLDVGSRPPGARLVSRQIPGSVTAPATLWLAPGRVSLRIELEGHYVERCEVEIRAGSSTTCAENPVALLPCGRDDPVLAGLRRLDGDPARKPSEKQAVWQAFLDERCHASCVEPRAEAGAAIARHRSLIEERQAALDALLAGDRTSSEEPEAGPKRASAWKAFHERYSGTFGPSEEDARRLVDARVASWEARAREAAVRSADRELARLEECRSAWQRCLELLDALCERAPSGWASARRVALLRERLVAGAVRRWHTPRLRLGWGEVPAAVGLSEPALAMAYVRLREQRPDRRSGSLAHGYAALEGLHGPGLLSPVGGRTAVEGPDVSSPAPASPVIGYVKAGSAGSPHVLMLSAVLLNRLLTESSGLDELGVAPGALGLQPGASLELVARSDPGAPGDAHVDGGVSVGVYPLDHLNDSFPFPAGTLRAAGRVAVHAGHRRGYFDCVLGGGAAFRSVLYGALPDAVFSRVEDLVPEEEPDPSGEDDLASQVWGRGFLDIDGTTGLVVRPAPWLETGLQYTARWSAAPVSPLRYDAGDSERSYASRLFHELAGRLTAVVLEDSDERRVVIEAAFGRVWRQVLGGAEPLAGTYTGRFIVSYRQPSWDVHVGLQHEWDSVSYYADYGSAWMLGGGAGVEVDLDALPRRLGARLDVGWALPLAVENLREPMGRSGFSWAGDDVDGRSSTPRFLRLRVAFEVGIYAGAVVGVDYRYRASTSDVAVRSPFGEAVRVAAVDGAHLLRYYVGYEF